MKKFLFYTIALFLSFNSQAQIHEIGIFAGGINYIGDVGPTNYIAPNNIAFGALYKWNRSKRHSYRFSYTQGKVESNDLDSDAPNRNLRGFKIKNNVKEFSVGLEFNFLDFDLHQSDFAFSPYVYSGLSTFIYNETFVINKESKIDYQHYSFAIPMTVGIKTKIAQQLVLGMEVGARYTFTDNLDGSNPKNKNFETLKFGNLNSNDWYVFSGITLTYTFGKNPCFCAD
ncbi:Protein of unknown function precursor, putative outer membrane protein [Flavobacterium indicum GPTSA100-9 = DSM 17447]|uniref:DUF6089 domain-containing protein n=1 Tax=Flavobacterium indicum (strain DSM 17447 / CIP 109464 / GPTSA100-9) TaxID=1094466 RepID=H8XQ81_FLAIG|nr:DUF6089 family protein [Flavobacterium indicum]CCG52375.1 Protein of unknown function precursor, putative outer membrane protein [Flavobacterium indicum GPTSA100-9 = DSM 17447]